MSYLIHVDIDLPDPALKDLRAGTAGHRISFSRSPHPSVLGESTPDPGLLEAEIAFGQPDPEAIRAARKLRWIHVSTSGITRYDTPDFRQQLRERGIRLSNSASVYQEACAEHAAGFLLAQARHLPDALRTRAPHDSEAWAALRNRCVPLRGQSLLLLGFGAIGQRLAELLRPLEMRITGWRRHPRGNEPVPMVATEQLQEAMGGADHVMNILPDNAASRGFFNATRLGWMKPGAVFYNIGRGTTVDQEALREALRSGRIAAAWLDVTDPEPLPDDHPLWQEPRCHITPHIAGGHRGEAQTLVRHFVENFQRFLTGAPLLDRVE